LQHKAYTASMLIHSLVTTLYASGNKKHTHNITTVETFVPEV